jgi:phosphonate degradation associated HDIG domain protein
MTATDTLSDPIEAILALMRNRGDARYGAEQVNQLQHGLQSAALADRDGAPPAMVVAALLHDIGHLVADDEDAAPRGVDAHHEKVAARYLGRWFPPDVVEPIRLHVAAKRYLCAAEKLYRDGLSFASERSLKLQGGPFTAAEMEEFRRLPYSAEAVQLRRWDEAAKNPHMLTPPLNYYAPLVRSVLRGA